MRLPLVPGPSDVIHAVEGVRDGIGEALALVPRVAEAVTGIESLLGRATALVARVEGVVDRVEGVVGRAEDTVGRADAAIEAVGHTQQRADAAIEAVGRTQQRADAAIEAVGRTQQGADEAITAVRETTDRAGETLTGAEGLLGRMDRLAEPYEEPLRALAPSVRRLAETLDPSEVEAVVRLIDQLPQLVGHLEDDILPVLGSLGNVGSDVRDLLDTMQDLRQVVKGFPGSRLFRRRGAEEIAHDEAEEDEAVGETGADRRVAGS